MNKKIEEINKLVMREADLDDHFVIRDILNGKKNLGEYKDFKKKIIIRHKIRKLYNAIEDYLMGMVLCSPKERKKEVHVDLVKGGFRILEE